jgi:putative acetyltransferase
VIPVDPVSTCEGVTIARATTPAERATMIALLEEIREHFVALGVASDRAHYDEEIAHYDELYGPPRGRMLLALVDGEPAGCACIRDWEGGAELRRVFVRPAHRRRGVARCLVGAAIAEARAIGYPSITLITMKQFTGAMALYASLGFAEIEPYRPGVVRGTLAAFRLDLVGPA